MIIFFLTFALFLYHIYVNIDQSFFQQVAIA